MKVAEKGSDRTAEVHLRAGAIVDPLAEFGEYVDPDDGAICCYVPVPFEEKQKIWISGRFSGTTQHIWYDAIVDGVHRKASSYLPKTVGFQKNKKLDTEKFMYKTETSTFLDTDMFADQIGTGVLVTPGEMTETIGTIELRVYVTWELGVEYTPRGIDKYHNLGENGNEVQRAEFKTIRPTLQMAFEQDSAILDSNSITRKQRKIDQPRPGKGPWAIFRFHYRTPESMAEHNLTVTYNPTVKAKDQPEARMLALDPVHPLVIATKKDDGDAASTQTSSPAPPDTPLTPIMGDFFKPTTSTPKKTQLKTMPGANKAVTDAESSELTALSTDRIDFELTNKNDGAASAKDGTAKVIRGKANESDTITVAAPKHKLSGPSASPMAPHEANNAAKKKTAVAVMIHPKGPQGSTAAQKPPHYKPKPIKTTQDIGDLRPTTAAIPATTPTKRAASPAITTPSDGKRAKPTPVPASNTPTIVSRIPPGSPIGSPRPLSTERKVAEQRKALEAMRKKRAETATKQTELDAKMKPYQKKMEGELERLRMEMLEEEALANEDEEHLKASEAMLAEFEMADGDN